MADGDSAAESNGAQESSVMSSVSNDGLPVIESSFSYYTSPMNEELAHLFEGIAENEAANTTDHTDGPCGPAEQQDESMGSMEEDEEEDVVTDMSAVLDDDLGDDIVADHIVNIEPQYDPDEDEDEESGLSSIPEPILVTGNYQNHFNIDSGDAAAGGDIIRGLNPATAVFKVVRVPGSTNIATVSVLQGGTNAGAVSLLQSHTNAGAVSLLQGGSNSRAVSLLQDLSGSENTVPAAANVSRQPRKRPREDKQVINISDDEEEEEKEGKPMSSPDSQKQMSEDEQTDSKVSKHEEQTKSKSEEQTRSKSEEQTESKSEEQTHSKTVCPYCLKKFYSDRMFEKHLRLGPNAECPGSVARMKKLHEKSIKASQDEESVHTDRRRSGRIPPKYMCDDCGTTFAEMKSLRKHMQVKHKIKMPSQVPGRGPQSYRRLTNSGSSPVHAGITDKSKQEPDEDSYLCSICNIQFDSHEKLLNHQTSHPASITKITTRGKKLVNFKVQPDALSKYPCKFCDSSWGSSGALTQHINNHHLSQISSLLPVAATSTEQGAIHLDKIIPPKLSCRFCDMKFYKQNCLTQHVNKMHKKDMQNPGKLPPCKIALLNNSLVEVIAHPLPREPKFLCPHCQMKYMTELGLKQHIRCNHTPGREHKMPVTRPEYRSGFFYKCTVCAAPFKRLSTLNRHMEEHMCGEMYRCNNCPIMFTQAASLRMHILSNHKDINRGTTKTSNSSPQFSQNTKSVTDPKNPASGFSVVKDDSTDGDNADVKHADTDKNEDAPAQSADDRKKAGGVHSEKIKVEDIEENESSRSVSDPVKMEVDEHVKAGPSAKQSDAYQEWFCCPFCDASFPGKEPLTNHLRDSHGNFRDNKSSTLSGPSSELSTLSGPSSESSAIVEEKESHVQAGEDNESEAATGKGEGGGSSVVKNESIVASNGKTKSGGRSCLTCPFCQIPYEHPRGLKVHMNTVHHTHVMNPAKVTDAKPVNRDQLQHCMICLAPFSRTATLMRHMRDHTQLNIFKCGICRSSFNDAMSLRLHIKDEHDEGKEFREKPYQCFICDLVFKSMEEMKSHQATHNIRDIFNHTRSRGHFSGIDEEIGDHLLGETGPLVHCTICLAPFTQPSTLKKHQRQHTVHHFYSCGICCYKFTDEASLKSHLKEQHNDGVEFIADPLYCTLCDERFRTIWTMKKHYSSHLKEKQDVEADAQRVQCTMCLEFFNNNLDLSEHMSDQHNIDDMDDLPQENSSQKLLLSAAEVKDFLGSFDVVTETEYKCKVCELPCYGIGSLVKHMKVHTCEQDIGHPTLSDWTCDVCLKGFRNIETLKYHELEHRKNLEHKCDICYQTFASEGNFRRHRKQHEDAPPLYQCRSCPLGFKNAKSFHKHALSHVKELPLTCTQCKKEFKEARLLKDHMNTHTGDQPYKCQECSRAFMTYKGWAKHQAKHRKTSKQKQKKT